MSKLDELLKLNGLKSDKKPVPSVIEISREDFELLDVEQETMYHIIEEDGTVTYKKGVNR